MSLTENTLQIGPLSWFYRAVTPTTPAAYPPVVLLHGLPSQSFTWCEVMEQLGEKGFSAIAPDWIGSGLSSKPEKREFAYTPAAYRQALTDFLQALNLEKFSLVVQGFLASVGIQYALANPERIERLVILNTPLTSTAKLPWAMKQWTIPFVGDMVTQDPLLIDRTLEGGSGFVISDEKLDVYRRPFLKTSASGRALMATAQNLNLAQELIAVEQGLQKTELPTALIWGSADPWLAEETVQNLAKSNPKLSFVALPEAKHYPQEHWPKEVSEALITFLRRQIV
ncbi:alpha/beta fold hydrolase [Synechocystis sp. LKSZ1]|uniref:alpha/beta fold hydrolase n=1 Tax=Synechocystis sp. LKSZ1 TaxID=3144951 RepID=UPI00336C2546